MRALLVRASAIRAAGRWLCLLCALAPTLAPAQEAGRIARGRAFVTTHCAACHAIGRVGPSPLAAAPPFRDLHRRYPVEELAEALSEGIVTGHPSMPEFQLDVAQIGDVIAYLRTLER